MMISSLGQLKKSLCDEVEGWMHKRFQAEFYGGLILALGYSTTDEKEWNLHLQDNMWDSPFDLEAFSDNDYDGASLDRKSTIGGYKFLGKRLISCNCYRFNQCLNLEFNTSEHQIFIDNESTICIVKNPVFHSKTKHIEIRHHFIRDCYEKKLIQVINIDTDHNVADLLTKAFDVSRFNFLIASIRLLNL
ncbi:hypothetical protein Tco_1568789 [Tanacetum coccineum]